MKSLPLHMVLHKPCTTNSKRQRSATILAVLSCLPIYRGTLQTFVMLLCGPLQYLVIPECVDVWRPLQRGPTAHPYRSI